MKLDEIIDILRERKEELRERFAVVKIGVYGSFAKGKERRESDVDIYVEFDMDRLTYDMYLELIEYLEGLLGREVDVITKDGVESIRVPHIRESIKRSVVYV